MFKSFILNRNFKKGQDCFSNKDYKSAAEFFRKAAEDGHADAQFNLGILYAKGLGVQKNKEDALRWLGKAAGQGHAGAKKELSILKEGKDNIKGNKRLEGEGIDETIEKLRSLSGQKLVESINYFIERAKQGDASFQAMIGCLYHGGIGVKKDLCEAAKWFHKAAEQGDALGQYRLSMCYWSGEGVAADSNKFMEWLKKAVNQGQEKAVKFAEKLIKEMIKKAVNGDVMSQFNVGYSYYTGTLVKQDYEEAIKWFKLGAEQGDKRSQYQLALLYGEGKNDYDNMIIWAKKLAEQGDPDGEELLGKAYMFGDGVQVDYSKAEYWFKKSAEKGSIESQKGLGHLYYYYVEDIGEIASYKEAAKWFLKAAEQGNLYAQIHIGHMYMVGKGVKKDSRKGNKWLKEAVAQDEESTKSLLHQLENPELFEKKENDEVENEAQSEEDPEELFSMGNAYYSGEGVEQDYAAAAGLWRKAADLGDPHAQFNLGMAYYRGHGVEKNLTEFFKWTSMAMDQGEIDGSMEQSALGQAYLFGEGTAQNFTEAVKWLSKASSIVSSDIDEDGMIDVKKFKQDADAQFYLGWCYLTGSGITKNIEAAERMFKAAASRNEKHSMSLLKEINDAGWSFQDLSIKIIRTHTKDNFYESGAFSHGHHILRDESCVMLDVDDLMSLPERQYELGLKYLNCEGFLKNEKEGAKFIIQAAEGGYAPASAAYADLLEEGEGVPQDLAESLKWRRKAAEQGDADAQFLMGYKHEHGEGLPQDDVEAVNWYRKSAEQGYKEGQFHYGLMLYHGSGVPEKNEEEGLKWIRLAVEQGHEYAESILADLSKTQETAPDNPLEELYRDGLTEKNAGNIDKAIVIWKKILEKDFRRLNAINAIACAYAETGKLDMAKKYIDMAMKVGGDQADFVRINLAGILYDSGKFEEAEGILNAIESKDGRMIDNLTRVLVAQGKSERALELIEEFLAKEGGSTTSSNDEDRTLQEIFTRGVDCILECKPSKAVEFLETYAHILPSDPLSSVYFNAGIHFLQEENDGLRALKCLSEAVRNKPDDSEAREALSDAALKVIADFGGEGKISENEKAALATAYETIGNKQKALEINRQIASVELGGEKRPSLRLVTAPIKPSQKVSTEERVAEGKSSGRGDLESFWNEVAVMVGDRTGLRLITSIGKNKAITQILFRRGSVKGVFFVISMRANDWVVRIDIDFGAGKDQENREFFDKLEHQAPAIEKVFGQRLIWEKGKGRSCKILCPSGIGGYKIPERLIPAKDGMVDMMVFLERAIGPVIEKTWLSLV